MQQTLSIQIVVAKHVFHLDVIVSRSGVQVRYENKLDRRQIHPKELYLMTTSMRYHRALIRLSGSVPIHACSSLCHGHWTAHAIQRVRLSESSAKYGRQ